MTGTVSHPWTIALWVARVLVTIPFPNAAWLGGSFSTVKPADLDLILPDLADVKDCKAM